MSNRAEETSQMSTRYTHALQYQQPDGSWNDGFLAYTLSEAKGVAREGRKRTGRAVRVVKIKNAS